MGKEREFKLHVRQDPTVVRPHMLGTITRRELKDVINNAFCQVPKDLKAALDEMVETTEYISWGLWTSYVREEDDSLSRCGCPLASVSDWVTDHHVFHDHPGQVARDLTSAWERYDRLMRYRYPIQRRLRVV